MVQNLVFYLIFVVLLNIKIGGVIMQGYMFGLDILSLGLLILTL
jgi:hypothetical protein